MIVKGAGQLSESDISARPGLQVARRQSRHYRSLFEGATVALWPPKVRLVPGMSILNSQLTVFGPEHARSC